MLSGTPIPDGDLLVAFIAFAETLNFTRAARLIGLSQPAFFERVQRLQGLLEVPLYRRAGRGLSLTEQGEKVAAHARELRERSQELLRALRCESARESAVLAAGEGSYLYLIGPALQRFAAGGGQLRLLTLGGRAVCEAVQRGEAHLGVGALDIVPPRLVAEELARTPLCLAMAADHRLARRRTIKLQELSGERLILAPAGQLHRDFVGRALDRAGFQIGDSLEADGWPLMIKFAQLGLGVAFVNGICELPAGTVARPIPELGSVSYRLIRRRGARLPEGAERLAELIRAR